MDRETVIEMILDPGRRPAQGSPGHQAFLAYLEKSPECRAMFEQQQGVWEALELWEPTEPSAGFDGAVYEKIERSQAAGWTGLRTSFGNWLGRPADWLAGARPSLAAGLAALLLIAGTIVTYQPRPAGDSLEAQRAPQVESESLEQIDQTLDDIEMLADFDALVLEAEGQGRT